MRQDTAQGGTPSLNSLPQTRVPAVSTGAWGRSRLEMLASSRKMVPSPMRQCAVSRPSSVASSLADVIGKVALEVAEERKRHLRAPFFSHEQHRRHRGDQCDRERGLDRFGVRNAFKPVAQRAIADLVVVLQEVDKASG